MVALVVLFCVAPNTRLPGGQLAVKLAAFAPVVTIWTLLLVNTPVGPLGPDGPVAPVPPVGPLEPEGPMGPLGPDGPV